MFVECYCNNGIPYLRLVRSIRRPTKTDPSKISSYKQTELSIGPLSRFDDGLPDYVDRLKKSFKEGKPLINSLKPYCSAPIVAEKHGMPEVQNLFNKKFAHPRYCSQILLDPIFNELGLSSLMSVIKHRTRISYPLVEYLRLLVYGRILDPASKLSTAKGNSKYFIPIVTDDSYIYHIYDTLDIVYKNRLQILKRLDSSIRKGMGRDTSLLFYDVTNFYFEIDKPDPDEEDEQGNVIKKGIRKKGVSKEERNLPIVQMGLFLDNSGIPVSIGVFPGNTLDHQTAVPTYEDTIAQMGFGGRFIFVADKGICTGPVMCKLTDDGNGYIISKSLRKSTKEVRRWATNPEGYTIINDDFKYKSRITEIVVRDKNGKDRKLKQKSVVYWSRSFYEKDVAAHASFLEFLEKLKNSPETFRVTKAEAGTLKRFMSRKVINKETGEILDSKKLLAIIDEEKVNEFTELMGYYQIYTSETDMDDREVIDKYHGLSRIENQFEELKGPMETRPLYVTTEEHIHAHLLICMISLVILRLIQRKYVLRHPPKEEDVESWTYGMSGKRVQAALQNWKAIPMNAGTYWFSDADVPDLASILDSFDLDIPKKLYTEGEIRRLKKQIKTF